MANNDLLNTPVLWINKYLQSKIGQDTGIGVPFFPSRPSTIDDLTETWITVTDANANQFSDLVRLPYAGVMATWDRLIKMNKRGFPHIKCEQLLYYFYATEENSVLSMVRTQEAVLRLLDRFDESAEEINEWCANRQIQLDDGSVIDNMFYFHNFKVYQLEETRDIIDFGTARTYGGNKIIIDFDYHQMNDLIPAGPEPRQTTKAII
jgi:hypothetical protein